MADKYMPGMEFQSWTSLPSGDQKPGALGKLAAYLIDQTGIKDFLDKKFGDSQEEVSSPVGSKAPPSSMYSLQPAVPVSSQGVSPMRLPNAVPNGIGLNASPAGAVNPFKFQTTPPAIIKPEDEHLKQVQSAWS